MSWRVIHADCIEAMREMDEASVDAVVCDPPYSLRFMGRGWDDQGEGAQIEESHRAWATEALRVLKPGGHLLAFGGTRTYHRLACAVEDAGFEIRDSLIWLYGSGFPKSLAVDKAIDRQRDDKIDHVCEFLRKGIDNSGLTRRGIGEHFGLDPRQVDQWAPRLTDKSARDRAHVPTLDQWAELKQLLDLPADMDAEVWRLNGRKGQPGENWERREVVGESPYAARRPRPGDGVTIHMPAADDVTAPATPGAQRWQGWGTALKPAHEPIVVARKPLIGTVAENVQRFGTGAVNVDECRIGHTTVNGGNLADNPHLRGSTHRATSIGGQGIYGGADPSDGEHTAASGRWPANVVLSHLPECKDGPDDSGGACFYFEGRTVQEHQASSVCAPGCPVAELDRQSGELTSGRLDRAGIAAENKTYGAAPKVREGIYEANTGGASRFFYTAKASRAERNIGLEGFEEREHSQYEGAPLNRAEHESSDGVQRTGIRPPRANHHPTVKPIELMRWLCRLVTPPEGTILDPFAGSGSTGIAAVLEGFDFVGVEREATYVEIAKARIEWWSQFPTGTEIDDVLESGRREVEARDAGQLALGF